MSLSTNVSNLATRIATEVKAIRTLVNGNAVDLSALDTTAKNNLVAAVNEVKGLLDTAASDITALEGDVGTLSLLTTTDKTDLVSAINELQTEIDNIDLTGLINDTTTATNSTWSSSKINSEITGLGDTQNTFDTLVKRDALTGGFKAGGVDVTALGLDTLTGAVISSSQGVLQVGGTSQGTNLKGSAVTVNSDADASITSSTGKVAINAATKMTIDAVGNIVINSTGGDAYLTASTPGNEIATESYVGTAIDAIGSVGATDDSIVKRRFDGGIAGQQIVGTEFVVTDATSAENYGSSTIGAYATLTSNASNGVTIEAANSGSNIVLAADGDVFIGTAVTGNEVATKSYVDGEVSGAVAALVDGAPQLLDTLNELAAAINDDASFSTTVANSIAAKADDQSVVKLTGAQTIAGVKTFSDAPVVPDSAFAIAKITGLQAALDAKASSANVGDTTTNYVTVFEAGLV